MARWGEQSEEREGVCQLKSFLKLQLGGGVQEVEARTVTFRQRKVAANT